MFENRMFKTNFDHIEEINSKQKVWKATSYDFLNEMKISDLIRMAGGKKSRIYGPKPTPAPVDEETTKMVAELPDSFGWLALRIFLF
jgi:hypothetical protein